MNTIFIIAGIVIIAGLALVKFLISWLIDKRLMSLKAWAAGTAVGIIIMVLSGSFYYAEPGHSYLVQYPNGSQVSHLTPGYHFYWYGTVLDFKKVVTVRLTDEKDEDSESASAQDNSVLVRFNDSVRATVSSSTRFRLPEDPELFKKLAVDYRTQSNLVHSSLVPITKEVIRNSARELSAQDYVTGQGGQFEANVLDQLENGIVVLKLEDSLVPIEKTNAVEKNIVAPGPTEDCIGDDCPETPVEDAGEAISKTNEDRGVKTASRVQQRVVRVVNSDGSLKRKAHPLVQYNVKVTQSTIERVLPEKKFQEMLAKQRDAAARSAVSRQEAKQAQYEKQKIIAQGETEKARIKMNQEQEQVGIVITAETEKKQAEIDLQTSEINKKKAKVDAEALIITKKAQAEGKRVVMVADGALEQKLKAWVEVNEAWARAMNDNRMVPQVVVGTDGKGSSSSVDFMSMMSAMAAKQLGVDTNISKR
ncbi:MAG: SPFH domain-containing protein [Planctomycetota bacterium]|jgi:regulator of protease activity HflC (stomatin/prohibitin superfamily)